MRYEVRLDRRAKEGVSTAGDVHGREFMAHADEFNVRRVVESVENFQVGRTDDAKSMAHTFLAQAFDNCGSGVHAR